MFGFKKKKKPETPPSSSEENLQKQEVIQNPSPKDTIAIDKTPENAISKELTTSEEAPLQTSAPQEKEKPKGLFSRLKQGLSKTSNNLSEGMGTLILGKKEIDDEVLEELETRLLMADVGMEATQRIVSDMTRQVKRNELWDQEALFRALRKTMAEVLQPISQELVIPKSDSPFVILMVGINGAGKTTTIGKLAKKFQQEGKSVMLAAGDTFRAAAVEQLQTWGERNQIPVVAQATGADTASVIYDAVESAKANNIDVLLADTAGRLHTQSNLMEELKKVKRVMQKLDNKAPHEVMLIVDASIGQNALLQAKEFNEALGLTGLSVTKLDGTAKGGILFAIAEQTGIPVRFIGVGESIDDLQVFNAEAFVEALLNSGKTST
ncbi:MAG: Signal recognition particle receptor protein FtsY (=alpha subunit) (TC 3.A.5.1.1) [uncultured Thiotrichaceae bacterium]|uniref:Signal recognition particle receptor FtsY n=1 Tax=uncultured Thiotrichaceae bacterium TaxID=298394 RepID=A0A6S6SNU4_9GAMM|nr:MAG: Signal recognition particle receptor protein FtsY (=alpha subunit) (TC 3.A.5.1.1) [uncultured Thiotrichaceae bacterium]